jgi:hypothetical protein
MTDVSLGKPYGCVGTSSGPNKRKVDREASLPSAHDPFGMIATGVLAQFCDGDQDASADSPGY